MSAVALTKCSRDGCEQQTANTFCSRECNRLAHIGPGTRAKPRVESTSKSAPMADGADATTHVSRAEWLHVRKYFRNREQALPPHRHFAAFDVSKPGDSSGARRVANIRKRRQEREALAQKRREAAKRRRQRG